MAIQIAVDRFDYWRTSAHSSDGLVRWWPCGSAWQTNRDSTVAGNWTDVPKSDWPPTWTPSPDRSSSAVIQSVSKTDLDNRAFRRSAMIDSSQ